MSLVRYFVVDSRNANAMFYREYELDDVVKRIVPELPEVRAFLRTVFPNIQPCFESHIFQLWRTGKGPMIDLILKDHVTRVLILWLNPDLILTDLRISPINGGIRVQKCKELAEVFHLGVRYNMADTMVNTGFATLSGSFIGLLSSLYTTGLADISATKAFDQGHTVINSWHYGVYQRKNFFSRLVTGIRQLQDGLSGIIGRS
jgi:hypothetical protein